MSDVRFSQAQVRDLLGLEPETVRHWRRCLAPLGFRRRKALYGRAELLALAVVCEFVHRLGVSVSSLAPVADELFRLCGSQSWPYLSRCYLRLEAGKLTLEHAEGAANLVRQAAVLIPLAPLVMRLGQALLGDDSDAQPELRFPLTVQPGGWA